MDKLSTANKKVQNSNEIDLLEVAGVLWKKKFIIAGAAILCAVLALAGTILFVDPQYQADILLYVNNNSISLGSTSLTFASGELSAARQLLDTYLVILKSRTTLDLVKEKASLPYSRSQLASMISAGAVNNTEVFRITVTSTDPTEARVIADTVAQILPEELTKIIKGSSVEIIDYAVMPSGRVSPSYTKSTAYGLIIGFVIICGIYVLIYLLNDKISDEKALTQMYDDIPILAVIPHGEKGSHNGHSGYDSGYGTASGSRR